jgi:putative ABC transport system permease protein
MGAEFSDIEVDGGTKLMAERLVKDIKKDYSVDWVYLQNTRQLEVDGERTVIKVQDSFEASGLLRTLAGRHPKHNNEVAVSNLLSKKFNKNVGDYVSIKDESGIVHQFLITGIFQTVDEYGSIIRMVESGMKVLNPKFELTDAYIKLKNHENLDNTINKMKVRYTGYQEISNHRKEDEDKVNTVKAVFAVISKLVFALTILMIGFVTLLIMKVTIYAETKELGIYKALGFSSARLRLQLALRFVIITFFGGILGILLETQLGSKMLSACLQGVGISSINLGFNITNALLPLIMMPLLAVLSSYVSSGNTKKVSPYELINE